MPKHRSLSLKTFVHSIPWDLFQRYFEDLLPGQVQHHSDDLAPERSLSDWSFLNEEVMEQFLGDSQNAEASGVILEQFRRINDIAVYGANLLVQAYQWAGATLDSEQTVQELAMRMFLDYPDAFQYAWTRYLLFSTDSMLTSYSLDVLRLDTSEERIGQFQLDLNRWFASQSKGSQCKVHCFQEEEATILNIQRGSYLRTVARWKGDRIEIETFRPATEDLLVYSPEKSALTIKASLTKEREFYLSTFSYHLAGDGGLAKLALETPMFSLEPMQRGQFDFNGNGAVTGIKIVRAKWQLDDPDSPELVIRSQDVLQTLRRRPAGISLGLGRLSAVTLRFEMKSDKGRSEKVSFDIEPPARTNLAQKKYADIIEEYLKEQGVKLR